MYHEAGESALASVFQPAEEPPEKVNNSEKGNGSRNSDGPHVVHAFPMRCIEAVSYTHLDVYKRQDIGGAEKHAGEQGGDVHSGA